MSFGFVDHRRLRGQGRLRWRGRRECRFLAILAEEIGIQLAILDAYGIVVLSAVEVFNAEHALDRRARGAWYVFRDRAQEQAAEVDVAPQRILWMQYVIQNG